MAPEIHKRIRYLGGPGDIWALGVILYKILTGFFPFNLKQKNENGEIRWDYTVPSSLSKDC